MTAAFTDTSIFQNILQWKDNDGREYRAEYWLGIWKISEIRDGISAFVVSVAAKKNATPKTIHKLMLDAPMADAA